MQLLNKTREDQEKEIRENFEPYATIGCRRCFGRGREYWIPALSQYKICDCVIQNVKKIKYSLGEQKN